MKISIVIPALNESVHLPVVLRFLQSVPGQEFIEEIIVSDGGSTDGTGAMAVSNGAKLVKNKKPGRALQMNKGAAFAAGEILYFLHADSFPPTSFVNDIITAVKSGAGSGCFRLRFDHSHWFLKINAWFTRFSFNSIRFGDQSLFVLRSLFYEVKGFREDHQMLEDQEIINRLSGRAPFKVLPHYITTSARKYVDQGVVRLQMIYYYIYFLYRIGYTQDGLVRKYKSLIRTNHLSIRG